MFRPGRKEWMRLLLSILCFVFFFFVEKLDPFDGAQAPPFRTGKNAPLRVNPEQALAFSPGSRRVDFAFANGGEDPMERREEKLKAFREKRDKFFKEDTHSPLKEADRKKFKGLLYYPIDLRYAMVGSIERYPTEPKPIYANLPTTKGKEKKYVKYGRFKFKWEGKEYVLQIYRPLGGGELFLPFKDKTSETETHKDGRYLYIEQMPGGKVLIDFNRAYNPFCEYNEKYTCPLASKENWLDIPIRAGEKRFR